MDIQSIINLFNNYGAVFISALTGSIIGSFLGVHFALRCSRRKAKPSKIKTLFKWLTYKVDVVN